MKGAGEDASHHFARGSRAPFAWLALLLLGIACSGCATVRPAPAGDAVSDPWEHSNRGVYGLNEDLDDAVLKPTASFYERITPNAVRRAVTNFFANLGYPDVIVNNALQGKGGEALSDTGRFLVNSTLGIGGLFDVAQHMGLPSHNEDFGQTLAVWGVKSGSYLVLPLFGPNTVRSTPALAVSAVTNVLFYVGASSVTIPLTVLGIINTRANASGAYAFINSAALDPYIFTREAYLQRRNYLIYDGHPPLPDFDLPEDDTPPANAPPP